MQHIEIELRYSVENQHQLQVFLQQLPLIKTQRIVDIYFDTPEAHLLKRGIYIRTRNNQKLEIKFNRACVLDPTLERQAYCEEYVYALPLHQERIKQLNEILTFLELNTAETADFELFKNANRFIEHYSLDKTRTTYAHPIFTIAIDDIIGLGTFLEIELMSSSDSDIDRIEQAMEEVLKGLELKPLKGAGYCELMVRKVHWNQYLQGRFVLDEDKKSLVATPAFSW